MRTIDTSVLFNIKRGITAVIGSGGKTTLIDRLAAELSSRGKVIVCTSTKIYVPGDMRTVSDTGAKGINKIKQILDTDRCVCVGKPVTGQQRGDNIREKLQASDIGYDILRQLADYVLVEADGSKGLPLKAHAEHEPVIPDGTDRIIQVIGISGIEKRIIDVAHRPELYASIVTANVNDIVTPHMAAAVINYEKLCDTVIINQIESDEEAEAAASLAMQLYFPSYMGALQNEGFNQRCR